MTTTRLTFAGVGRPKTTFHRLRGRRRLRRLAPRSAAVARLVPRCRRRLRPLPPGSTAVARLVPRSNAMGAPAPGSDAVGFELRWVRALAISTAAWATASGAHLASGGQLPAPAVILATIILTAWPLSLTLTRRASRARLVCLLIAGQAAMHASLVFLAGWADSAQLTANHPAMALDPSGSLMTGRSGPMTTGLAGPMTTGLGGSMPVTHSATAFAQPIALHPMAAHSMTAHSMTLLPSPAMLLAHCCAAILLGSWLAVGENVLFSLLGLLSWMGPPALRTGRRAMLLLAALATGTGKTGAGRAVGVRVDLSVPRLPRHLLVRSVIWRGPPAGPVCSFCPGIRA